jgi:hypothetical protein
MMSIRTASRQAEKAVVGRTKAGGTAQFNGTNTFQQAERERIKLFA